MQLPIPELPSLEILGSTLNAAITALLASDPGNENYLLKLENAQIEIHSEAPEFKLWVRIDDGQVTVSSQADTAYEKDQLSEESTQKLRIAGTSLNLIKLLSAPLDNASSLKQSGVEVSGDVGLLIELSRLIEKIEIDWEGLLSEQIGEFPAVILSRTIKTAVDEAKKAQSELSDKLKSEFKQRSDFPDKAELDTLKTRLRDINYRLDRLEAARNKEHNL